MPTSQEMNDTENKTHTFQMAPLEALYHTSPGLGLVAPTLAMLIITPPSFLSMAWLTQALQPRYTPLTLTSNVFSNSSSVTVVPALLTRISQRPNFSIHAETVAFQSADLVTSILWKARADGFVAAVASPPD
ncbi:hypothetical protein GMOD_00005263 [Pyrenophora seminiperda CCB06]|uniref:Uncharacterized protein n=1 Tax=Pyrenophora seminiperda CCB06 TaxID=1302712 RepID=A0A3M7LVI0_9PLEO|nr:hypothetical protein GMOD_00005263 [Pyrenophora seminiperda CCB06]